MPQTQQTLKRIAPLGGDATLKKYGKAHYRKLAAKRWTNAKRAAGGSTKKATASRAKK